MAERILIVEDEDTLRESLRRVFEREDYEVVAVSNAESAFELFEEGSFDLVITDIILPGMTGIELIKRIKEAAPDQAGIVMTAYASLETAVETLRAGAYDYIVKPIIHEEIKQTVRNALKLRALQEENALLKEQVGSAESTVRFIGEHPDILAVKNRIKKVVEARSPVLVQGEIGTGKKLLARVIHQSGPWAQLPLIEQNCGGLSATEQLEALFGQPPGSRLGTASRGILQKAKGGTIYLNRVDALAPEAQKVLLGVLEERQIRFPGQTKGVKVDALLISGTEKDLELKSSEGTFLTELLQRLGLIKIQLPPLRDRGADLESLVEFYVGRYCGSFGKQVEGLAPEAWQRLKAYAWPGNVLELRNLLERAVLLTRNDRLQAADFPPLS